MFGLICTEPDGRSTLLVAGRAEDQITQRMEAEADRLIQQGHHRARVELVKLHEGYLEALGRVAPSDGGLVEVGTSWTPVLYETMAWPVLRRTTIV